MDHIIKLKNQIKPGDRLIIETLAPAPDPPPPDTAIYVSAAGDDANPGTIDKPLKSIQHAVNTVEPGDTIYVRAGTYTEHVQVAKSGTKDAPIKITAYPGERPVIDGQYTLPFGKPARCDTSVTPPKCFVYTPLVKIAGNHIQFTGFEVMRSRGRGIGIEGSSDTRPHHIKIRDCSVHDIRNTAIHTLKADDVLVEGCDVYHGADFAPYDRSSSTLNWPVIVNTVDAHRVTYRRNTIHESWGEGIAADRGSTHVTIEDNIIFDNFALQVYVHRAQNVTVARNLIYHTNNADFLRGGNPSQGVVLNNEPHFTGQITVKDIEIVNNIIVGCRYNISIWRSRGSGLLVKNVLIAHNTLVNAVSNSAKNAAGLRVAPDNSLEHIRIENNIVLQDNHDVALSPSDSEITAAYNLWSRTPPASLSGAGDVIGDPRFIESANKAAAGIADQYHLRDDSPAVGAAMPSDVVDDYLGRPRSDPPSIGAHEW